MRRAPMTILVDTRERRPLPIADVAPNVAVITVGLGLRNADYTVQGLEHKIAVETKRDDLYNSLNGDYPRFKRELTHLAFERCVPHRVILVCKTKRAFYEEVMLSAPRKWDAINERMDTIQLRYGTPIIWRRDPHDAALWLVNQLRALWGRYSNPRLQQAVEASIAVPPKGAVGGANLTHEAAAAAAVCSVCFRELPKTEIKQRDGREYCPCGRVEPLPRR